MAPQPIPGWLPMLGYATAGIGALLLVRDLTRFGSASVLSLSFELAFDLFLVAAGLIIAAVTRSGGINRRGGAGLR